MANYNKWRYLERARNLLSTADDDALRYACLELRFCIEAIIYQKLDVYTNYVPAAVFKKWQPTHALKMLLQFEPDADEDFTLYVSPESEPGKPTGNWTCLGEHRTIKASWLNKNYNKLGSYLHVKMNNTRPVETQEELSKIRTDIERIFSELEPVVNCDMLAVPLATRVQFKCQACDQLSFVNRTVLRRAGRATCINQQCGAEYNASEGKDGRWQFKLAMTPFKCLKCEKINFLQSRRVDIGIRFRCNRCGEVHHITDVQCSYERLTDIKETS